MRLAVTVLHNVARGSFAGYDPATADLRHGHTFQVTADSVDEAGKLLWTLGNVDGPDDLPEHLSSYGNQVWAYRQRMNRSVSVGDVVMVYSHDDSRMIAVLVCEPVGWRKIAWVPEYEHGSNDDVTSKSYDAYCQTWASTHRN